MAIRIKKGQRPPEPERVQRTAVRKEESNVTKVALRLGGNSCMHISTGNCQDQGARSYQEDSFGYSNIIDSSIVTNKGMLAILSDGMGGLADGKAVSEYAVQASISMFDSINPHMDIGPQLKKMILAINEQICAQYTENGVSKAGATMVLAHIYKNCLHWATIGDSRLYCVRNGKLVQLNEDHDYKNTLFRDYIAGKADFEDAQTDPQKDSLVSFIGKEPPVEIDVCVRGFRIRPDDAFILCSDGIYNGISAEAMTELVEKNNAQAASEKIVKEVVDAHFPGQDNMTIMVIKCSREA